MTDIATAVTVQTGAIARLRRGLLVLALLATPPALLLLAGSALAADMPRASTLRIVVPVRDIMRGEVVGESDLTFADITGTTLSPSTATKFETLTGMQTRRMLRAGDAVRAEDVRRPVVVTKGQTVTMIFSAPGVELSAMGRAMSEGGVGDTVTVQNPASFRMVSATVTGAGTVRAEMASPLTTARK
jgi:flagellar basal body P-ring formation protein FlgA